MNLREIAKERSFLTGYVMYISVENPIFNSLVNKLNLYNNILLEARRKDPYFDADWR